MELFKYILLENLLLKNNKKLITEITAKEAKEKFYSSIPDEDYKQIIQSDPTYNKEIDNLGIYTKWLLNLYKKKQLKLEDLYKAKEYLTLFNDNKKSLEKKDINQYKSLPDLFEVVEQFRNKPKEISNTQKIKEIKSQSDKFEYENWLVVIPKTKEASCYYGANTQWCTAARENNVFDKYNENGNLFIFINKNNPKEKYQLDIFTRQFMDVNDREVSVYDILSYGVMLKCIKYDGDNSKKNDTNLNGEIYEFFNKLESMNNFDDLIINQYSSYNSFYFQIENDYPYNTTQYTFNVYFNNILRLYSYNEKSFMEDYIKPILSKLNLNNIKKILMENVQSDDYHNYGIYKNTKRKYIEETNDISNTTKEDLYYIKNSPNSIYDRYSFMDMIYNYNYPIYYKYITKTFYRLFFKENKNKIINEIYNTIIKEKKKYLFAMVGFYNLPQYCLCDFDIKWDKKITEKELIDEINKNQ